MLSAAPAARPKRNVCRKADSASAVCLAPVDLAIRAVLPTPMAMTRLLITQVGAEFTATVAVADAPRPPTMIMLVICIMVAVRFSKMAGKERRRT